MLRDIRGGGGWLRTVLSLVFAVWALGGMAYYYYTNGFLDLIWLLLGGGS